MTPISKPNGYSDKFGFKQCSYAQALLICATLIYPASVNAVYIDGCNDPKYQDYVEQQFDNKDAKNRRLLNDTLRDYELRLASSNNTYQIIASLSRHLRYSAQFESQSSVEKKIKRIFEHADQLTAEQKIAGDVYDSFSSETHSVSIARAWIAYRNGDTELAFEELLWSIEMADSAILGAFGPDFNLVRRLYRDGHVSPVLDYIDKTEDFWTGKRADELRNVWRKMIDAECKIQFDSVDVIKAAEFGLTSTL